MCEGKRTGRPGLSAEKVIRVLDAFLRRLRKSIHQEKAELQISGKVFCVLYEIIANETLSTSNNATFQSM